MLPQPSEPVPRMSIDSYMSLQISDTLSDDEDEVFTQQAPAADFFGVPGAPAEGGVAFSVGGTQAPLHDRLEELLAATPALAPA